MVFLTVYVDDIRMAGNTQNVPQRWATLHKKVDLYDPVSFIDQVYLGCFQRTAQVNNIMVMEQQESFWKRKSTKTDVKTEQQQSPNKSQFGTRIWKVHAQMCVQRFCEVAHKTVDQLHEVSTSCLDDHQRLAVGLY